MAEQTTHTLPLREKVPSSDKWHIEDIFADDNAFLAALSACRTHINALSEFKNHSHLIKYRDEHIYYKTLIKYMIIILRVYIRHECSDRQADLLLGLQTHVNIP